MEKYTIITEFPTYSVSNYGNIKNQKGLVLKGGLDQKGYRLVCLRRDNESYTKRVARIVASYYVPNPYNLPEVNHLDGDRQNNHYLNLEWSTSKGNVVHSYQVLKRRGSQTGKTRGLSPFSKKVDQLDISGNLVQTWGSLREIAEYYNVTHQAVKHWIKTDKYYKTFKWKFHV